MNRQNESKSPESEDTIYDDENKLYGAYTLRVNSSKPHLVALLITALLPILIVVLSLVMDKISGTSTRQQPYTEAETVIRI